MRYNNKMLRPTFDLGLERIWCCEIVSRRYRFNQEQYIYADIEKIYDEIPNANSQRIKNTV